MKDHIQRGKGHVDVDGQLRTGVETDPYVMDMFPVGEAVTVGFAEDCLQVLPVE